MQQQNENPKMDCFVMEYLSKKWNSVQIILVNFDLIVLNSNNSNFSWIQLTNIQVSSLSEGWTSPAENQPCPKCYSCKKQQTYFQLLFIYIENSNKLSITLNKNKKLNII